MRRFRRAFVLCFALALCAWLLAGSSCRALVKGERDFRLNEFLAEWYGPESNFLEHKTLQRAGERIIADERQRETMRLNNLAVARVRLLQFKPARDAFRECLKRKPLVLRPYLNFAEFERLLGRVDRARALLREMVLRPDMEPGLLLAAVDVAREKGGPEVGVLLAEVLYEAYKGKSGDDTSLRSAVWLGRYYLSLPDYKPAAQWLDRALAIDPNQGDALYGMGVMAYLAEDYARAVEFLEPALKNGGRQKPLRLLLAESLHKEKRVGDALAVVASTPGEILHNDFGLLALRGKLLMLQDWRTETSVLLKGVESPALRRRLLHNWFGDSNPDDIRKTRRELELLY